MTRQLAAFGAGPAAPAPEAEAMLRLSLFDWAACALAATGEPVSQAVRGLIAEEGGAGQATVVGGGRAPMRAAALANGATSHALDYDDTHFVHIGHPSVAVIPAALAVAEAKGRDMAAFRESALIGAEASIRYGLWLGREHYQTGFHQTATAGAIGATVAAGRLMGLDEERMGHALGLVSTRASGLRSQFGTMGKPFNAGIAASNGVEAAALAARGFVSNPDALGGPQGFGPTHAGQGNGAAFEGLGGTWLFETVSHKFHACCHGLHAMLEAFAGIAPLPRPGEVTAIRVTAHPRWDSVCNIAAPRTGLEAKFSFRLVAAMALAGRPTAALASFSGATANAPELCALRDRVAVDFDEALPETGARVAVTFGDGRILEAAHDLAAPLAPVVRAARLRGKAQALLGDNLAGALWERAQGGDLAAFAGLLGG